MTDTARTPPAATPPASLGSTRPACSSWRPGNLFDVFNNTAMGTVVVDRGHRIVWISEGYGASCPRSSTPRPTSSAAASKRWCPTR
ncbi:MAG: hypothetical protein U1F49_07100 [Rubrivivax sp.]